MTEVRFLQPAPDVDVLQNDSGAQSIRLPDGSIMSVFH